jgi:hypothetical protein
MSDISPRDATKDLMAAFKTYWEPLYPAIPIAWPNSSFDPAELVPGQTDAWVRVFTTGFTDQGHVPLSGSVATNYFQEQGRFTIEVYVRQGSGDAQVNDLAYAAQGFVDGARVSEFIFSNRTAAQHVGGDGAWYQVIQAADWVYFTNRAAP